MLLNLCAIMTQIAELIDVLITIGNTDLADQRKQDASSKNIEEGLSQKTLSQDKDHDFKVLNIQETGHYPVKDLGKPRKKCDVFLILLVSSLFVILLLPPPFWLLMPVLILLYICIRLYKRKNRPQNHGPAIDESQSELCNEPRDASPVDLPTISPTQTNYWLDLSAVSAKNHPPKLQNFGNTCFFNAALQAIISTSEFYTLDVMPACNTITGSAMTYTKQYMVYSKTCDVPLEIEVTSKPGPLTLALNRLLRNVLHKSYVSRHSDLLTQLGRRNPRFIRGSQEDSHEVLRCILDGLKVEEIQPVKTKIESLFSGRNLDGEDKLAKKVYLRMASKVQTAIGQIVEGKFISVTICHECYDVTENVESFFDISLAMPEKEQFKKKMTGKVSHTKLDHSQVEMKGSSKDERKETRTNSNKVCPENGFKSSMQSPTSSVLFDKNLTHEKEITTQSDTADTIQNDKPYKATDIDMYCSDENGNDMHQYKVTDIDSMCTLVGESKQQCGDMQDNFTEKVDETDLHNNVVMKLEDRTASETKESDANLEVRNMLAIDKSKSSEGAELAENQSIEITKSKTQMSDAHSTNSIGVKDADQHGTNLYATSPNSDQQNTSVIRTCKSSGEVTGNADVTQQNSSNSPKTFTVMLKGPAGGLKCNVTVNSQQNVKEDGKCLPLQHSPNTEEVKGQHQGIQSKDTYKESQSVEENGKCHSLQNSSFPSTKEVKQQHQNFLSNDACKEDQMDCNTSLITEDKDAFQQHLIKNGLNHLAKVNNINGMDHGLQLSLLLHTDLDVLDENNKFICQKCSTKKQQESGNNEPVLCQVSKQIMIHQLPPVLILHMKRFEIGYYEVTKDCQHISFPEILDMAPYCTTKCLEDSGDSENVILYGLYAVVVHSGGTLHGGHYIAYIKTRPAKEQRLKKKTVNQKYDISYCKKGQWYYTSDTTVMKCSFEDVTRSEAYMLFYEQLPLIDC